MEVSEHTEELEIAEKYLTEMLDADLAGDYKGFIKYFDKSDIDECKQDMCSTSPCTVWRITAFNKNRTYLGSLNDLKREDQSRWLRFNNNK